MNWWKPELYQRKITFLQERQKIIKSIRNYFDEQGFFEVETPSLQISPGLEVHLKAFKTSLEEPFYDKTKTLYLHTSPEFSMKKLLVAGLPKIYQICHVYRNAERSDRHHPEFTMIEWYRANDDYLSIMEDCKKLIRNATKNILDIVLLGIISRYCGNVKRTHILNFSRRVANRRRVPRW